MIYDYAAHDDDDDDNDFKKKDGDYDDDDGGDDDDVYDDDDINDDNDNIDDRNTYVIIIILFIILGNYVESSVIIINKLTHKKFIEILLEMLPYFHYGYGEKEIFWIAATISGEDWSFEPFLAGQYGDCTGLVLHFDPDDYDKDINDVSVMFINAEYLVEYHSKVKFIGQHFGRVITTPVLVTGTL